MSDPHWQNLKDIFHTAVALLPDERRAYLDRACEGDVSLRRAVESLLKSHEETGFVDQPAYQAAANMLMQDQKLTADQTVGRYRIISLIGEGGMGRVYLAEDTRLHRKVSLKFLSTDVTRDHERLRRFEQEARAASALNHPNIITIHEIGEEDGQQFIATEFIEGQTLRERLRSPMDLDEALEIAIQAASALVAAHRVNIVHRDIKPENIMIRKDDGLVKVLDFGLAKITVPRRAAIDAEADTQLRNTAPGVVMGTVAYMSPEQARGETVDERTDIWSLGVVLYEMVAGCSPFVAATSNEIMSAILSKEQPPPLTRHSRVVPERLEEIVEKALTKNRDERYQTSKDLLIDLKRLQQTLQVKAASERSTSPDRVVPANADGQAAVSKSETNAAITQQASSAEYIVNQVGSHKRAALIGLAVIVLAVVTGVLIYGWRVKPTADLAQRTISSIAVLPLVNTNSDADTEFLSDGITDNIIAQLSRLPDLKVMAHTAVFTYKNRQVDVRTVGTELGVEAVLAGRVTKRGDLLTINLELVNAKDNSFIWGERYDRRLSELLTVQREIPADVSAKLRPELSGESKERLTQTHTTNPEAYQLYLKGRYSWEKRTEDGSKQAVEYFNEAIRKNPNYAAAYAGLADAYIFGQGLAALSQKEEHRLAREAAMKALQLEPTLGEAHAALAVVLFYDDWDFAGAEREFKRAIELSPNYAEAHHQYSHLLLALGRIDESLIESKKFLELDPVSDSPIGHLGYHYSRARQYDEAMPYLQKAVQLVPSNYSSLQNLADAYYGKGMFSEMVETYIKVLNLYGLSSDKIAALKDAFAKSGYKGYLQKRIEQWKSEKEVPAASVASGYARLGEKEPAFEWLEKAYAERDDGLLHIKEDPSYDILRSDPRYADLLRRIGLPQ